jgi:EAL domain-containing protein (putative c-di-GMP-specific phosphodiesterase class I)
MPDDTVLFSDARPARSRVAEGIENESVLIALRALGVEYGQGYFLGRPSDDLGLERAQTAA